MKSQFLASSSSQQQQADLREFRWACGEILKIGDRELTG
jgi:hypothetical protein